jgi:hypothetical protein
MLLAVLRTEKVTLRSKQGPAGLLSLACFPSPSLLPQRGLTQCAGLQNYTCRLCCRNKERECLYVYFFSFYHFYITYMCIHCLGHLLLPHPVYMFITHFFLVRKTQDTLKSFWINSSFWPNMTLVFSFLFSFFWDCVLLHGPCYPWTPDPPASDSQVLGVKAYTWLKTRLFARISP